jgi:glucose/arabinose dehydrogenase
MHGTFTKTLVQPGEGGLQNPQGVAIGKDQKLYVVSAGTNQILRYELGTGSFIGVFANLPRKCGGTGMIAGPDGNWFVACSSVNMVLAFNAKSGQQLGVAARGGGLKQPQGIAFAPGNVLYVVSKGSNSIAQYAQGGYFRGTITNELQNGFDVAINNGKVYSTGHKHEVTVYSPE